MSSELTADADDEGNIVIKLPADLLQHYVEVADVFQDAKIVDLPLFAKDLVAALIGDEEEDGTNHLHRAFDSAFDRFGEGHLESRGIRFEFEDEDEG